MTKTMIAALLASACITVALIATSAQARVRHHVGPRSGVKVGVLNCQVAPGVGLIIVSSKQVQCTFRSDRGGTERYVGSIGKLGIDIGVTGTGYLGWVVFAPGEVNHGALAGSYVGASAQATVVVGAGANLLVGGFNNNINLQPFSVQGQTGLNLAVGLGSLNLRPAG